MKKLLFPLILTVTGNTFTAPKPQKTKSTRNSIASRILESEKKRLRKWQVEDLGYTNTFN